MNRGGPAIVRPPALRPAVYTTENAPCQSSPGTRAETPASLRIDADLRNDGNPPLADGDKAIAVIARPVAYALRPTLMCLDEPTSGVSTRDKAQIMDIVSSVVRDHGITAIVVEHDMDVVFKYSDRIVVMHQGAILADGTPDEIRANDEVATVLLGGRFEDRVST